MKGSLMRVEMALEAVPHASMPPNCEILTRAYVGDLMFGLARDPKSRALYLLSLHGYWRLDTQALVTAFASALRDLDAELAYARGASITNFPTIVPAAPLRPRRSVWGPMTRARRQASGAGRAKGAGRR